MSSKFFNDVKNTSRPKTILPATTTGKGPSTTDNRAPAKPRIFIGLPVHDSRVHTAYMMGIFKIVSAKDAQGHAKYDITLTKTSSGGITKARNDLVWRALKTTCDYIWFTDSDMALDDHHLDALLAANEDIIGVLYCHKKLDLAWSARHLPDAPVIDGKQKVAAAGFGGILIKRHVFETMAEKMPELRFKETWSDGRNEYKFGFFQERVAIDLQAGATEPEWETEDWFFLHNARKLGFEPYVASGFHVQHHEGGQQFPNDDVIALADALMSYKEGLQDGGAKAKEVMETVIPGWNQNLKPIEAEKKE